MASRYNGKRSAATTELTSASKYSWRLYRYSDPERIASRIDIAQGQADDWAAVFRAAELAAGWDRSTQQQAPASIPRDLVLAITRTDTQRTVACGLI